jgi:hypothetical protein
MLPKSEDEPMDCFDPLKNINNNPIIEDQRKKIQKYIHQAKQNRKKNIELSFGNEINIFNSINCKYGIFSKNVPEYNSLLRYFTLNRQQFIYYSAKFLNIKEYFKFDDLTEKHKVIENSMLKILKASNFRDHLPVSVKADGYCFYSSVSFLLFGSDNHKFIIKLTCIFIMIENRKYFEEIFRTHFEGEFEPFILKHMRSKEWTDNHIIQSCSILLNRPIYVYSINDRSEQYNFKYVTNDFKSHSNPLLIAFYASHFSPILKENKKHKKNNVILIPDKTNIIKQPKIETKFFSGIKKVSKK